MEPVRAGQLTENPDLAGWLNWYIILKDDEGDEDVLIGSAGFNGLDEETGTVVLGFSILKSFQRNGYASEACRELVQWAFNHDKVRRVVSRTFPDNKASVRVMENLGMNHITDPADPYVESFGKEKGAVLYGVTRGEWEEQ